MKTSVLKAGTWSLCEFRNSVPVWFTVICSRRFFFLIPHGSLQSLQDPEWRRTMPTHFRDGDRDTPRLRGLSNVIASVTQFFLKFKLASSTPPIKLVLETKKDTRSMYQRGQSLTHFKTETNSVSSQRSDSQVSKYFVLCGSGSPNRCYVAIYFHSY